MVLSHSGSSRTEQILVLSLALVWASACIHACSVMSSSLWSYGLYSLPDSSVHGISQARILEWVTISSSRGSSWPRDRTPVSCVSCIAGRFFTAEPPGKITCGQTGPQFQLLGFLAPEHCNSQYSFSPDWNMWVVLKHRGQRGTRSSWPFW